jgi:exopolyphosphatase / guanosine-5'-triphosphate,3'-diphosphate pyrophosphatase
VDGRIEIVERCSELVQLGEDVRKSGRISPFAFQRGLDCLQHFKSLMDNYPLEQYWALGTNTFRVTSNAPTFIEAAYEVGIEISIVSGVQEAVLIYAGVITSLPESDEHRLVIDIGGGSTEIIIGHKHSRLLTQSMPIGSVAWRDKFFANNSSNKVVLERQLDAATDASLQVFEAMKLAVDKAGWSEAYASSGTMKMLATICQSHGFGKGEIQLEALLQLKSVLIAAIAERKNIAGLKERRRELLLPGWAVLVGLMRAYSVDCINFSSTALREGMLDFMVKNKKTLAIMQNSKLPEVSFTEN